MKTIVIGDVHGCYNALQQLLKKLKEYGCDYYTDRLIFLGDYIDRGADSAKTVSLVRELQRANPLVVPLLGNHEQMLIDHLKNPDYLWDFNGGDATRASYMVCRADLEEDAAWMQTLPLYFEDEKNIYVHAGIRPGVSLQSQKRQDCLWIREPFLYAKSTGDKRVIFGHTPSLTVTGKTVPYQTPAGNLGLDTGCVFNGKLSALVADENGNETVYQY